MLCGVEVLSDTDVVDSSKVLDVEDRNNVDDVDSKELDCEEEIACPTTAAILVPVPLLQQS